MEASMKAVLVSALLVLGPLAAAWAADGNPARGQREFGACPACHSLEPDKSMTGPSLSGLWNRKAGDLVSFARFSDAVKSSGVVWNDKTLDAWITDPQHLIPGNQMTFPGIKDGQQRADLLAFLKDATQPGHPSASAQRGGQMGMMRSAAVPNLTKLDPDNRVSATS